ISLRGLEFLPLQFGSKSWLLAPAIVWSAAVASIFKFSRPESVSVSGRIAEVLRTIGLMTYPLYLVHHIAGITVLRYFISTGSSKWLALPLSILLTVVL